jgi:hypothetical protein
MMRDPVLFGLDGRLIAVRIARVFVMTASTNALKGRCHVWTAPFTQGLI